MIEKNEESTTKININFIFPNILRHGDIKPEELKLIKASGFDLRYTFLF